MHLAQVPAKPNVTPGCGQLRGADVDDGSGQEMLRNPIEPAQ